MLRRVKRPSKLQLKEAFKKGYKKALRESRKQAEDYVGQTVMYPVKYYLPKNWHPGEMSVTVEPLFYDTNYQLTTEFEVHKMDQPIPISTSGKNGDFLTLLELYKLPRRSKVFCAFDVKEVISSKYSESDNERPDSIRVTVTKLPNVVDVGSPLIVSPEFIEEQ